MKRSEKQKKHAKFAETAIKPYIAKTGTDRDAVIRDLLSDLKHWCDINEVDFYSELDRALITYDAEINDEL